MDIKKFSQEELNRIVAVRVKRERERLTTEFENKMKRCMASVHLTLHQEMCALRRDMATETQESLFPAVMPNEAVELVPPGASKKTKDRRVNENDAKHRSTMSC